MTVTDGSTPVVEGSRAPVAPRNGRAPSLPDLTPLRRLGRVTAPDRTRDRRPDRGRGREGGGGAPDCGGSEEAGSMISPDTFPRIMPCSIPGMAAEATGRILNRPASGRITSFLVPRRRMVVSGGVSDIATKGRQGALLQAARSGIARADRAPLRAPWRRGTPGGAGGSGQRDRPAEGGGAVTAGDRGPDRNVEGRGISGATPGVSRT